MQTSLASFASRLGQLKDEEKGDLCGVLDSLRGRKTVIMENSLRDLFSYSSGEALADLLKNHGVHFSRDLIGAGGALSSEASKDLPDHIVYFIRPAIDESKAASREIATAVKRGVRSQFHVYFVPSRSVVCEQMFEDEGVMSCTTFGELSTGLLPVDSDLITMEMRSLFRQYYLDGDSAGLGSVARALLKLQRRLGVIPRIKSKGAASKKVLQMLLHYRREEDLLMPAGTSMASEGSSANLAAHSMPEIDTLVLIDRDVDLFSVMASPLTYEGLIDEVIGIRCGQVHVDASVLGDEKDDLKLPQNLAGSTAAAAAPSPVAPRPAHAPGEKIFIKLTSADTTYLDIRDLSVEQLGKYLQDRAMLIKTSYSNFREKKDASIVEIHDFVKKIPKLTREYKYLTQHINIAQLIHHVTDSSEFREVWQMERGMMEGETFYDQIEDIICMDANRSDLCRVLRLMVLQSLTGNGIRTSKYDQLKRLIAQTYGFHHTFTLCNLERMGALKKKDLVLVETLSSLPWNVLKKQLRLINDSVSMINPTDMSYVSAGYAPLSARLVQALGSPGGWAALSEVQRLLPGPVVEITQGSEAEELSRVVKRSEEERSSGKTTMNDFGPERSLDSELYIGPEGDEDHPLESVASDRTVSVALQNQKPVMLVFFVGGLSFIEVAALRFLSKDPSFPYTIVMGTTCMINGNTLLESVVHHPTV